MPFGHSTYSDRLNVRVRYAHVGGEQAGNCWEAQRKARCRVYRSDSALPNTRLDIYSFGRHIGIVFSRELYAEGPILLLC